MTALLEVQHLRKIFPVADTKGALRQMLQRGVPSTSNLHAVDDISFELRDGESLGLVGESGCGKSTLVNLLARLSDPSSGGIRFQGQEIGEVPAQRFRAHAARAQIQVVFQDANDSLNPRFTAFDNIAEPLRRLERLGGAALQNRVTEIAERVGLPSELLRRYRHQLSGGQRARVNIGRAIAVNPRLLILDEPTSALDVSVQAVILKLLARLRAELGMSFLFVSHDLNVVRLLCNRVLVMYLGKIVEMGDAERIFTDAQHPYTQGLISAIPCYRPLERTERLRLSGEPRSPIDPDPCVCRFLGRCPRSEHRCQTEAPELVPLGRGHASACHFHDTASPELRASA